MLLNFPTSPTLNQEYTLGVKTWVWDGVAWTLKTATPNYLSLSGGTLTGNLGLGVTPAAWDTFAPVLELPGGASLLGVPGQTVLSNNFYYGGGASKRIALGGAAQLAFGGDGQFYFQGAPSGAAGSSITWTTLMSLNASGDLNTTGALKQAGNQVLHAGNYSSYAASATHTHNYLPSSGAATLSNGYLAIASTDPTLILQDTNNSGTGAGQTGSLLFRDATGVDRASLGYTSASWPHFEITNSKGDVNIQGSKALTVGNYSTVVTALNGYNATGTWPISVTGSAGSADVLNATTTSGIATSVLGSGTANSTTFLAGDRTFKTITAAAPTTAQVLTATAGATAGAVGSYMFARSTGTSVTFNATYAGSTLQPFGLHASTTNSAVSTSNALGATQAGTWRCMTNATSSANPVIGLFLRIS